LLLHEKYPGLFEVIDSLIKAQVAVRGCEKSCHIHPHVKLASEEDYDQEYLDQIISLKIVKNEHEALDHIKKHTSHHTEGIIARSEEVISEFLQALDASVIVVNASTRFNDGGELGLGAELGISTSKLHAYGPMGAKEMTTTRFLVIGNGQVR
jgi:glutamate-5-semialdehyde dehydrogenase